MCCLASICFVSVLLPALKDNQPEVAQALVIVVTETRAAVSMLFYAALGSCCALHCDVAPCQGVHADAGDSPCSVRQCSSSCMGPSVHLLALLQGRGEGGRESQVMVWKQAWAILFQPGLDCMYDMLLVICPERIHHALHHVAHWQVEDLWLVVIAGLCIILEEAVDWYDCHRCHRRVAGVRISAIRVEVCTTNRPDCVYFVL